MGTFDYARAQAAALRLITKFGATQVVRRMTPGTGPAQNPGPATPVDHAAVMVVLDYSTWERQDTSILAGDKKVLIAVGTLAIAPTAGDFLVIGGVSYRIIKSDPLQPAGTVVFWTVQARR